MKLGELNAKQRSHLYDFVIEQRREIYRAMLHSIVGARRSIAPLHYAAQFGNVLGVRMAWLWGCTRGTANVRLQRLEGLVRHNRRWGLSHANSYRLPEEQCLKIGTEAAAFWKSLGYPDAANGVSAPMLADEKQLLETHLLRDPLDIEELYK